VLLFFNRRLLRTAVWDIYDNLRNQAVIFCVCPELDYGALPAENARTANESFEALHSSVVSAVLQPKGKSERA